MPFNDPNPLSTHGDSLPRRFQEVELRFGSSKRGLSIPVVPTSGLPAASTALHGTLLIEDIGTSFAFIAYWNAERRRFLGTTF